MEEGRTTMLVRRALNNNAVVAERDGHEVIVMGPGIGFGAKRGAELAADRVERVFYPTPTQPMERLTAFLAEIPAEHLELAVEICDEAASRLSVPLHQSLLIAVADHLSFAIRRQADDVRVDYPLAWEVAQLYPDYLRMGKRALQMVEDRVGVRLPAEEAVSFAMHLIIADAEGDPYDTPGMRQLTMIGQIFDLVDSSFEVSIDRESMSAARFVTHLRYLFARIHGDAQLADTPDHLVRSIADNYSAAMVCAHRIAYLVQMWGGTSISTDEIAFVALHVARLVQDLQRPPRSPDRQRSGG